MNKNSINNQNYNNDRNYPIHYSFKKEYKKLRLICKNQSIFIKAPENCPQHFINEFIKDNIEFIQKNLQKELELQIQHQECHLLATKDWLFEVYDNPDFDIKIDQKIIFVPEKCIHLTKQIIINRIYNDAIIKLFDQFLDEYSSNIEKKPKRIVVKKMTSAWGKCSADQLIYFDPFVATLPKDLIHYIFAHELAHLVHLDHSKKFWAYCDQIYPKARFYDRVLKGYCKK